MVADLLPRQLIRRYRVAVAVAERLGDMRRGRFDKGGFQVPGREKIDPAGLPRPHRMAVAPDVVGPVDDLAVGSERCLDLHRHSRTEGRPGELVVPHPLQLDRHARNGTRDKRCVQRDIVRAIVPVASGAGHMDDVDLGILHAQHLGQIAPQGIRTLGVGPHRHASVLQPGDRAGRADCCVGQVGAGVFGADSFRLARHWLRLTGRAHDDGLGAQLLQLGAQTRHVGKLERVVAPMRARGERVAPGNRLLLTAGSNGKEIAVADDRDHAGTRAHRGLVECEKSCAVAGRPDHPRKDHSGKPHVLDIGRRSRQLAGQIDPVDRLADDGIVARLLRRRRECDISLQQAGPLIRQLPKTRAPTIGRNDRAVPHLQLFRADAKPTRRRRDKDAARLGAGRANGAAALLDRLAAERVLLIGSPRRVGGDHADLVESDVEFLRRDLRQRGQDPLPELGLAGEDRHRLIRLQADPSFKPAIVAQAERHICRRLAKHRRGWQRKRRKHHAQRLRDMPAGKPHDAHRTGSMATFRTALTTRLWMPHRQSWSASASLISSSLGFGLRSSKALAAMIMPFEQ